MTTPTDICPGCRELWSTLPALHFCLPPDDATVRPGPKWEGLQDARSVDSDAVAAPGALQCHCARLLPALRRWLEANDAVRSGPWPDGLGERQDATDTLDALVREVLG